MMIKESFTKIVNFMTLGAGVHVLGHGNISHIVKMHYFYSINIQHIDCYCIKGLKCCFPMPLLIFIFSMMWLLICKYEPF